MSNSYIPLPILGRFYIYGLQGECIEVFYTALCELLFIQSPKLAGVSSVWAFFHLCIFANVHRKNTQKSQK
jgi:hypothetical protein